ncbi:hypothetical protein N658DRAFT_523656, partial [Parathielavia hyrcaniae]
MTSLDPAISANNVETLRVSHNFKAPKKTTTRIQPFYQPICQTFKVEGKEANYAEIEELTGIKPSTFKALARRARERGHEKGGPVKDHHVEYSQSAGAAQGEE